VHGRYVESTFFVVPGQGSWNVPVIRRQPRLASTVELLLAERRQFTSIKANSWTGRIRLAYGMELPEARVVETIEAAIEAALSGAQRPAEPPDADPTAALDHVDRFGTNVPVGPVTKVDSDVKTLLVAGGIVAGLAITAHVANRARELFPASMVNGSVFVWLVTSAGLIWVNLRESNDKIKIQRSHAIRQLRRFARPYRRQLVLGQLANLGSRIATVGTLTSIGLIVDAVTSPTKSIKIGRNRFSRQVGVFELGVMSAGLITVANTLEYFSRRMFMHGAHQIAHNIRVNLYAHIQSLKFSELADSNRGNYFTLLNEDINRIVLLFSSLWEVSREMFMSVASMGGFYLYHPGFVGMVLTPLPGLVLVGHYLETHIRQRMGVTRAAASTLGGVLSVALDGIETIRATAREKAAVGWVAQGSDVYRKQLDSAINLTGLYDPLATTAGHGLRAMTGYLVSTYAKRGQISTGNYISILLMCGMITIPLRGIARDLPHILSTLASLSGVFEAFELETEDPYTGESLTHEQAAGDLKFKDVDFAYPSGVQVLENFSVEIPAGKTTAFVGETGSGKSTLAKLLLRFHEPTGGTITINDRDLRVLRPVDVRRSIAYVGQDIFLFNGTISQNIAFSEDAVDMDLVVEVARTAEAHEFIERLPHGYETQVGERGQKLSGGQRQRIGIARALYTPKPIVILDEATSALDSLTETKLYERLSNALVGRTVIVIAHRLSAVKGADRIHVLHSGKIVETGTHEELVTMAGGRYARYWRLQTDQEFRS
jgi:ATP-binding cassette subfamily B protein